MKPHKPINTSVINSRDREVFDIVKKGFTSIKADKKIRGYREPCVLCARNKEYGNDYCSNCGREL